MRPINENQQMLYAEYDQNGSKRYMDRYRKYLDPFLEKMDIRILDIGGASGHFAMLLKEYFAENGVQVYVVDTQDYDTWREDMLGSDIHFIRDSVENLETLFPKRSFDIVFANRVFHHFVDNSWRKSLAGMKKYLASIRKLLKDEGMFFAMDHFYDGMFVDSATSFLIYKFTAIQNPVLARIVRKLGAMTAGVGVCFLSEKMWKEFVQQSGMDIIHIDRSAPDKLNFIKKIGLLSRKVSRNNIICAKLRKM